MPNRKPQSPQLDLSYANSATLLMPPTDRWRLILVGCGGTGSWLAPSIARIAAVLQEQGKEVAVEFIDHDHVEQKNIPRQHFSQAEFGLNKAATLAFRYGAAWGVDILARAERFTAAKLDRDYRATTILIGCVDNAAARREMAACLKRNRADAPHDTWWLDCGNTDAAGQVLVGSAVEQKQLAGAFLSRKTCKALPAPSLVAPDLLKARPEETAKNRLSCAEMQLANAQSMAVNQNVAAIATDYLSRMAMGGLRKRATFFDLESGSARSLYLIEEDVR